MLKYPTPYLRKSLVSYYKKFNLTQAEMDEVDGVYDKAFVFMQICGTGLLLIGVPGNLLVIFVLRGKSMRRNLTALFLTYLAAFNLLNLLLGLTRYVVVSFHGPDVRLYSETLCLLHKNAIVFGHLGVNWTVLAVGICKMAYVIVPDTLMRNLPKSFVHSVMLTMSTYGYSVVYLFANSVVIHDTESSFGLIKCEQQYLTLAALTQMFCSFLLPEAVMFFVNVTTIRSYHLLWSRATASEKKIVKVNYILGIMVFISDIQLLLAEVPYIVINTFKPLIFTESPIGAAKYLLACYLSVAALYSNYAFNCLSYCFFGGHFRRELRNTLRPVLSLVCDPESRWVSSKTSVSSDLDYRSSHSLNTGRLSLSLMLAPVDHSI
ncbi:hypothetical protein RRG08_040207 [Elysia crispata]|uniref:G-protein coupled receptors family 1 profile domain-containing protein n=1 Tax=Elysia crispata TaxID=231223 RepID=A0AAE0XXY0_9GAST|nr:hypothetical protein RRG08_040207 [Elysia crispata]KAK3722823.1 hypothetical protein RRG08_040207 [Elysia crispata]